MRCCLIRFFCGFFLLSLLLAAPQPLCAAWHNTPVGYPIINSIVTDSSGSRIWFYASGAGIWTTSDGGNSWLPASNRMEIGDYIVKGFQAVDAGADTLIARLGQEYNPYSSNGFRSFDGGETWERIGHRSVHARLSRPNEWLGYGSSGLEHSLDYGQNWSACDSLPFAEIDLFQDSHCDSCLFAVGIDWTNSSCNLWYSANLGIDWTEFFNADDIGWPRLWDIKQPIHLSNGNIVLQFGSSTVISADTGRTWQWPQTIPGSANAESFIEDLGRPGQLFLVGGDQNSLLRSTDYGQSWTVCFAELPGRPADGTVIYQNRFSQTLYFASSEYGLQRSTDHGNTWQQVILPPIGNPWSALSVTPDAVFCRNRNDSWQRESNATSWQEISLPRIDNDTLSSRASPVFFKHGDSLACLIAATQTDAGDDPTFTRSALSTDNGMSWVLGPEIPLNFGFGSTLSYFENPTQRWLLSASYTDRDHLMVSHDLGQSWRALWAPPGNGAEIHCVTQDGPNICTIVTDTVRYYYPTQLYSSTDWGISWRLLNTSEEYCSNPVIVDDHISVVDAGRWSHWNGYHWEYFSTLPEPWSGHYSYNLTAAEIGLDLYLLAYSYSEDSILYVTQDWGRTVEARTFEFPFSEQNLQLNSLTWDPYRQRLWASTGIGVCYLDGSELSAGDAPLHFKPADFTVLAAYPNPFNGSTRIRYDLDRQAKVQLQIFDLQGRLVTTLLDDISEPGRHELHWNADNQSSGTYFVRLQTPQSTRTQKLLLLK